MCFALPPGHRDQTRQSRLPHWLRVIAGGVVLLAILLTALLVERLSPFTRKA